MSLSARSNTVDTAILRYCSSSFPLASTADVAVRGMRTQGAMPRRARRVQAIPAGEAPRRRPCTPSPAVSLTGRDALAAAGFHGSVGGPSFSRSPQIRYAHRVLACCNYLR